ncbi:hypothetical protein MJG53_019265 [Ovis ammon polii x Ovis aries]|uniref:Uncharacterized protein n=1 Tax=Ovis ammon polii x Ovis aries TaxID=2918886 RepID=A0ACB9U2W2_9CETA|nr:hypothetical protein MJG53_019265 [Ovis ammon polii x Ovis aries]
MSEDLPKVHVGIIPGVQVGTRPGFERHKDSSRMENRQEPVHGTPCSISLHEVPEPHTSNRAQGGHRGESVSTGDRNETCRVWNLQRRRLETLVGKLVPAFLGGDPAYLPTFLGTYRAFGTPQQVLDLLFMRYGCILPYCDEDGGPLHQLKIPSSTPDPGPRAQSVEIIQLTVWWNLGGGDQLVLSGPSDTQGTADLSLGKDECQWPEEMQGESVSTGDRNETCRVWSIQRRRLETLVGELVPAFLSGDSAYLPTFLGTYRAFGTPQQVLDLLFMRYGCILPYCDEDGGPLHQLKMLGYVSKFLESKCHPNSMEKDYTPPAGEEALETSPDLTPSPPLSNPATAPQSEQAQSPAPIQVQDLHQLPPQIRSSLTPWPAVTSSDVSVSVVYIRVDTPRHQIPLPPQICSSLTPCPAVTSSDVSVSVVYIRVDTPRHQIPGESVSTGDRNETCTVWSIQRRRLETLVGELVPAFLSGDSAYLPTFLGTYRAFGTPQQVLDLLFTRYGCILPYCDEDGGPLHQLKICHPQIRSFLTPCPAVTSSDVSVSVVYIRVDTPRHQIPAESVSTVDRNETCRVWSIQRRRLETLVGELVPAFLSGDSAYLPTFLGTYRAFSTPQQVLDLLFMRYGCILPYCDEDGGPLHQLKIREPAHEALCSISLHEGLEPHSSNRAQGGHRGESVSTGDRNETCTVWSIQRRRLETLVGKLVPAFLSGDSAYLPTFLGTYRAFGTPQQVLDLLFTSNPATAPQSEQAQSPAPIQVQDLHQLPPQIRSSLTPRPTVTSSDVSVSVVYIRVDTPRHQIPGESVSTGERNETCRVWNLQRRRLEMLVGELVPAFLSGDPAYLPTFLGTYRAFGTPQQVLDLLFTRYGCILPYCDEDGGPLHQLKIKDTASGPEAFGVSDHPAPWKSEKQASPGNQRRDVLVLTSSIKRSQSHTESGDKAISSFTYPPVACLNSAGLHRTSLLLGGRVHKPEAPESSPQDCSCSPEPAV